MIKFNSKKLVKSETLLYGFAEVGIKGGEIFYNVLKFHVHACLSNGHSNLWSNFNYTKLLKSETSSCLLARVGLKGGQNSLRTLKKVDQDFPRSRIVQNPLKVFVHGYLSNKYLNSPSNFTYKKVKQIASLRPLLDQPWIEWPK